MPLIVILTITEVWNVTHTALHVNCYQIIGHLVDLVLRTLTQVNRNKVMLGSMSNTTMALVFYDICNHKVLSYIPNAFTFDFVVCNSPG